jgi:hypothetical protein
MKKTELESIQEVYDAGGSIQQIAADLDKHQVTIERWREWGVPESYHIELTERYGQRNSLINPYNLYKLSLKIRGYKAKARKAA